MSMKPGATTSPAASRSRRAVACDRSPSDAILPSRTPTSTRTAGAPVPSITVPCLTIRSSTPALPVGRVLILHLLEHRERGQNVEGRHLRLPPFGQRGEELTVLQLVGNVFVLRGGVVQHGVPVQQRVLGDVQGALFTDEQKVEPSVFG